MAAKWNMGGTIESKPKKQGKEEDNTVNTPLPLVIKLRKDTEGRESELLALRN